MLEICAIASGSNGNCYYIGNERGSVLVDAGISCKQILLRMDERGLNPARIQAVFISHEHIDHIRGARVLAKKLHVPVYFSPKTFYAANRSLRPAYPRFFNPGESIVVDEFTIHSFLKKHDASEPCSFRIEHGGRNIGVFTDIGEPCENVTSHLGFCDAVFMESNYDDEMLQTGSYPFYLKQRISSSVGHLSNVQSFRLLQENAGSHLRCVFLSHLSAENNTPDLALNAHLPLAEKFEIRLTSRSSAADIFVLST